MGEYEKLRDEYQNKIVQLKNCVEQRLKKYQVNVVIEEEAKILKEDEEKKLKEWKEWKEPKPKGRPKNN